MVASASLLCIASGPVVPDKRSHRVEHCCSLLGHMNEMPHGTFSPAGVCNPLKFLELEMGVP